VRTAARAAKKRVGARAEAPLVGAMRKREKPADGKFYSRQYQKIALRKPIEYTVQCSACRSWLGEQGGKHSETRGDAKNKVSRIFMPRAAKTHIFEHPDGQLPLVGRMSSTRQKTRTLKEQGSRARREARRNVFYERKNQTSFFSQELSRIWMSQQPRRRRRPPPPAVSG
jgi:hypothetical protein